MNAIRRKIALAAAVLATLGAFGTQAPAQPAAARHPARVSTGEIRGRISFNVVFLLGGFNSSACSHFKVVAKNVSGTIVRTSRKMHASLQGKIVECAYSIERLPSGRYTVVPRGGAGLPLVSGTGQFNGSPKTVTLRLRRGIVSTVSHVDFQYGGSTTEHTAPAP